MASGTAFPFHLSHLNRPFRKKGLDQGRFAHSGVTAKYDVPQQPDLSLATDQLDVSECVEQIVKLLETRQLLF